jgi:cation diffusion facilitator CzcD-associated flavoprotein CzcO
MVHLRDLHSNETYKHISKILFNCAGFLITPYTPPFPGRDIFTGPQIHSARWDPKFSLVGKKVAVIGNGCTASQLVPSIAPEVAHLTQFMRSAHWIQPPIMLPQSKALSWVMNQLPIFQQIHRFAVFLYAESDFSVQSPGWFGKFRRTFKANWVKRYMLKKSPKKYHHLLIPDFEIACKRRIYDSEPSYLSCLHNDNVELTKDRVERLTETGVVAAGREILVDVVIYATGFATGDIIQGLKIAGRDGKDLGTEWKENGGAGAYEQTAVSGWPNFFMVLGPNSATGHTSALMAAEK